MRFLARLSIALISLGFSAGAEPARELVIEKARDTYGAELPQGAEFNVSSSER